jgi:hypothetical protein
MGGKPEESENKPAARAAGEESDKKGSGFRSWNGRRAFKKPNIQQAKFEGKCVGLKGFIYDCSDSKQADIFTKTMKEVVEYVGQTYSYGSNMRLAIENLEKTTLTLPMIHQPQLPRPKKQGYVKRKSMNMYERNHISKRTSRLYTPSCGDNVLLSCKRELRLSVNMTTCRTKATQLN